MNDRKTTFVTLTMKEWGILIQFIKELSLRHIPQENLKEASSWDIGTVDPVESFIQGRIRAESKIALIAREVLKQIGEDQ